MEKLALIAAIASIPAIIFILAAKVTGQNKILLFLGLKLPALIAAVALILMSFVYFGVDSKVSPQPVPQRDTVTITVPEGRDTIYFDMCSSCVHFDNCIKCQKYEQELIKKGLINP